jgi:hypothetical protein
MQEKEDWTPKIFILRDTPQMSGVLNVVSGTVSPLTMGGAVSPLFISGAVNPLTNVTYSRDDVVFSQSPEAFGFFPYVGCGNSIAKGTYCQVCGTLN